MQTNSIPNPASARLPYLVSRIRRNHGLEHATLHLLSRRFPRHPMAGYSDVGGFWLLGDVPTEDVMIAAQEALGRMRQGERNLALHPNCGTNFLTAGLLAGTAAFAAMIGAPRAMKDRLERLPLAAMLGVLAIVLAQPLGMLLQERVTTSGEPGELRVSEVRMVSSGRPPVHRVTTRG